LKITKIVQYYFFDYNSHQLYTRRLHKTLLFDEVTQNSIYSCGEEANKWSLVPQWM